MIGRLNHVGVATPSIAQSVAMYRDMLGATQVSETKVLEEQGVYVCFVDLPNSQIELIEPYGDNSPIHAFLAKNPKGGQHHVCFEVPDIIAARDDMRAKGAALGILVTEAMPRDMDRFGNVNGVWICSFGEFKALCYVLREMIVRIHEASSAQDNRGDKMAMLYDYLTGNEFRMQIEGIVEGFTQMQDDLESERRAMERLWKQREKQIQKVLLNTTHLYASIRGIAGNAIGTIRQLELPGSSDVQ